jgi:CRISPR-associated endonuclease Csn1
MKTSSLKVCVAAEAKPDSKLHLAFDVGHSSIGWAVLETGFNEIPELKGCGAVVFPANDCLASQRRLFRRQRRHIRATRQRIERMKVLLGHLGVLTREQLDANERSWPWLLAARVHAGGQRLTWSELWDVLRWYAHNRGYDGNKRWSAAEAAAEAEDTEKVNNARELYSKYGTTTMAATFCAVCGLDPLGKKRACALPGNKRPKGLNAAFPREDVEAEVRSLLETHVGVLPELGEGLIRSLFDDWRAIPCEGLKLPGRFRGGLLFGQLVPRFDNRIVGRCPIMFERVFQETLRETGDGARAKKKAEKAAKTPSKECREFYEFRWAMQLANVMVCGPDGKTVRLIQNKDWRRLVDAKMRDSGFLTPGDFKKVVREVTGGAPSNLGQMLLHPDAQKALLLDPVKKMVGGDSLIGKLWGLLPDRVRKRAMGKWRRGKTPTVTELLADIPQADRREIDAVIQRHLDGEGLRRRKKDSGFVPEKLLAEPLRVERLSGRAPYHREVLREAVSDVMERGIHPTEEAGCLYRSEAILNAQLQRGIDEQTNNHLVRHRLLILERLHRDILKEYAGDDKERVGRVTIEVNRDLKEMSGKTAKEVAQDLGKRLANFKGVSERLERAYEGKNVQVTAGLIRKARIAEDLGWKCPYTGKGYDEFDLLYRNVDKDHIIPRSQRPSDGLDSLVITFTEVNRMKGKRTAFRFIEEEQGKTVEGMPSLNIKTLSGYTKDVESLESFKGHDDDQRRKKNRKRMLMVRDFVEKEFIPGDLTQTSQLVRLGAQTLQKQYLGSQNRPAITSLPGSVTGAVRKSWNLLGCLSAANPQVLEPATGEVRTKTEIRDITHLHHALDACILAFAAVFLPGRGRDGEGWKLLVKRRLNAEEQRRARELFKTYVEFEKDGTLHLIELPFPLKEQIRHRLAECRVVQHVPAEMGGLRAEQNAWRVVSIENGEALLRQRLRQPDGSRVTKETREKIDKLVGLNPGSDTGKLERNKAALVIPENYGLSLDPEPTIIPFHKVWPRLEALKAKSGGKNPRILRNGSLIRVPRGKFSGVWKIFSVKNNSSGMALDIGRPDVVRLRNKVEGHKINVLLASLLRDGMGVQRRSLTGIRASG